jgi:ketosteroid isomerase-like protein
MSQGNVEIVEQLYERIIATGKMEDPATARLVPEFFDPEVHLRQMSGFVDTTGDFYGYEGIVDSTRELVRSFSNLGFVPEEIRAAGDQVAAVALATGTGRRSGAAFEKRVGHLFSLREGRVVRWEVFDDPADAFRAAGLSQ